MRPRNLYAIAVIVLIAASWQTLKTCPLEEAIIGHWLGRGAAEMTKLYGTLDIFRDGTLETDVTDGLPPPGQPHRTITVDRFGNQDITFWSPPRDKHTVGTWCVDGDIIKATLTFPSGQEMPTTFKVYGSRFEITHYINGQDRPLAGFDERTPSLKTAMQPLLWTPFVLLGLVSVALTWAWRQRYPVVWRPLLVLILISVFRLALHPLMVSYLPGLLGVQSIFGRAQVYRVYQIGDTLLAAGQVVVILTALYRWRKERPSTSEVVPVASSEAAAPGEGPKSKAETGIKKNPYPFWPRRP